MVDIFPQIFRELKERLTAFEQSVVGASLLGENRIKVSNTYLYSSQKFPCVVIEEMVNNEADGETDLHEKHSSLMYEINVYDNSKNMLEICRKIATVIDGYMSTEMGFKRVVGEPFPNTADSTVYRYLLRYEGYIDTETGNISRILN